MQWNTIRSWDLFTFTYSGVSLFSKLLDSTWDAFLKKAYSLPFLKDTKSKPPMQQHLNSLNWDLCWEFAVSLTLQPSEGFKAMSWCECHPHCSATLFLFVFNTSAMSYSLLQQWFKGWNDRLLTLVIELGLTESLPVQYMLFFYHWNKKLWYFSCGWIFSNSWLMTNIYPTSPCAFNVFASLDFYETTEGIFFPLLQWQHKIDIVTVTEANKYCANLVSFIDALPSVYVFVTLH